MMTQLPAPVPALPRPLPRRLASEKVVVSAPFSFEGSAKRLWKMTDCRNAWVRWLLLVPLAVGLIGFAWSVVLCWYLMFGLLLVPFRLVRRHQRSGRKSALQHRELLDQIGRSR